MTHLVQQGATRSQRPGGATVCWDVYREGPIEGVTCRALARDSDSRGWLVELFRRDELPSDLWPHMAYLSLTNPGVVRGPHEHRRQSDLFAFLGPGDFKLYLWDARPGSPTRGHRQTLLVGANNPQAVIVPPGVVHGYRNVSDVPACVVNLPNCLYRGEGRRHPVDEIRHEDDPHSPFLFD